MLKWMAAILILSASVLVGMFCNSRMTKRISQLESALEAVRTVRLRIDYFLEPLDAILALLRVENPLFRETEEAVFGLGWQNAFLERADALSQDERAVLAHFGARLGGTDREGQLSLCGAMQEKIADYLARAKQDRERYARLAATLPVLVGVTVVVLFL